MKKIDEVIREMSTERKFGPDPLPVKTPCRRDCEVCGGSGIYTYDVPFGHKLFGLAFACPNRPTEAGGRLVTWEDLTMTPSLARVAVVIQETLERGYGWVYLYGAVGVGKTTLLKATRSDKRARGTVLTDMLGIIDHLRASFDLEKGAQQELLRRQAEWITYPTLLIDEFDRFKQTEFAQDRLYTIMNGRYDAAIAGENSITIMASNQPPTIYEPYLRSRIEDGRFVVINVDGPDLRPGAEYDLP